MAQVHPFTNPFFKSATFEASNTGKEDSFSPYGNFFNLNSKNNPWGKTAKMSQDWFEFQQKYWQEYMELATWGQQTFHQNLVDSAHAMMHCMQLSTNPAHMYRYIRRNWQKPYMAMGAQSLTATKMLTKLMTQNMAAWQQAMGKFNH